MKLTAREILFFQNKFSYLQDEESYKKLFYHFYPILLKFSTTILTDEEESQRVVSDVLLKLWTMGKDLNYVENLTIYLYKATRNKAYDLFRKKNIQVTGIDIFNSEQPPLVVDDNNPEKQYIKCELERYIHGLILALPTQSKLVYQLIKEQGLTHKQVSEVLGISLNTVETHMRRTLKKLRTALNAYLTAEK